MIGTGIPILPITRCTTGSRTTGPTGPRGIGPRSSFSSFVHSFQGSGFILRRGGDMSNFTTGITPRYWALIVGCEMPGAVRGCADALPRANRTTVIAAKASRTPTRMRSLKNADLEADFFFIGWSLGLGRFVEMPKGHQRGFSFRVPWFPLVSNVERRFYLN